MSRKRPQSRLAVWLALAIWAASANSGFAFLHGHRRYPGGNSPTYPSATPHGGFSSSNGYYSGRSRIVDSPSAPISPNLIRPVPAK